MFLQWQQIIHNPMTHDLPCIQAASFLTLHYRLAGPAGEVINTFGGKPATLSLGTGELSPEVERCLIGLEEGVHRTFDLPAGVAFGPRNPEMLTACCVKWTTPRSAMRRATWCSSPRRTGKIAMPVR